MCKRFTSGWCVALSTWSGWRKLNLVSTSFAIDFRRTLRVRPSNSSIKNCRKWRMGENLSLGRRCPKETELRREQFTFRIQMQIQVTKNVYNRAPSHLLKCSLSTSMFPLIKKNTCFLKLHFILTCPTYTAVSQPPWRHDWPKLTGWATLPSNQCCTLGSRYPY